MIARWKPVHLGHAAVLQALFETADQVVIGIGSSNKYDAQNPFTAQESREMIELVLCGKRYEILEIPDLGHGPRWREMVKTMLGPLDLFVTANGYVKSLLENDYRVVHPASLTKERIPIEATMVRRAIARNENWQALVPAKIARYLESNGLIERLRAEFGGELCR